MLEVSLSLAFMAMFLAALMAASSGIDRLTRGYTCRIVSADPNAATPEAGCSGQSDEVTADTAGVLKLANQSALRALRDDLLRSSSPTRLALEIAESVVADPDRSVRRSALETRCLWEKLTPLSVGRFRVVRNYWRLSPTGAEVNTTALPAPSSRASTESYWLIRGGRLIRERGVLGNLARPAPGLQAVEEGFLSVDPSTDAVPVVSQQEQAEAQALAADPDPLENAPNSQWGFLNQVCLYQAGGNLNRLYLLSAQRGSDLGGTTPPWFGRDVGVAARQPAPRLLFSMP